MIGLLQREVNVIGKEEENINDVGNVHNASVFLFHPMLSVCDQQRVPTIQARSSLTLSVPIHLITDLEPKVVYTAWHDCSRLAARKALSCAVCDMFTH